MAYTQAYPNFVPEIWAKEILRNWDDTFHMKNVVNRDYEGEIKRAGDVVHIPYIGDIGVSDYDNTGSLTYASVDDYTSTLTVNQQKSYSFKVEDLGESQSAVKDIAGKYIQRAMVAVDDVIDTYLMSATVIGTTVGAGIGLAQTYHSGVDAADWAAATAYATVGTRISPTTPNGYLYEVKSFAGTGTSDAAEPTWPLTVGGTVIDNAGANQITWVNAGLDANAVLTKATVYSTLVAIKKLFIKANTWEEKQMWAIVPPEVLEFIETSTELTHATDKADDLISLGFFGRLAGFNILVSNNCSGAGSAASPFIGVCGNTQTIHFAENFIKGPEFIRLEGTFDDGIRGLCAYGAVIAAQNKYAGVRWEIVI